MALFCLVLASVPSLLLAQQTNRVIELTVYAQAGGQAGTQQRWIQALSSVGADRVSSVFKSLDRPTIDEETFGGSTIVSVKAVLKNDRLLVPNASFRRTDVAKLKAYLQRLRDDGSDVALADKQAFGLTAEQLRDLHRLLSQKVKQPTANRNLWEVVNEIVASARLPLQVSAAQRQRLRGNKTTSAELEGFSVGTALASLLQQQAMKLVPQRPQGGSLSLQIVPASNVKEFWPVGSPPKTPPVQTVPTLFDREDIRIERFPLAQALDAIAARSKLPFLYDRLAISDSQIDLTKVEVVFVKKRSTYMRALNKLLRQTDPPLASDVRIDENGKPFVWIYVRE